MDTLRAMQVFVEVARCRGFAPAAKALGLSTSSVSRHVTNLEDLHVGPLKQGRQS